VRTVVRDFVQKEETITHLDLGVTDEPYALFLNEIRKIAKDFDFVCVAHDDVVLESTDTIHRVSEVVGKSAVPIGWVGLTDTDYLNSKPIISVRPGFHEDYVAGVQPGRLFQFHQLDEDWWLLPRMRFLGTGLTERRKFEGLNSLLPKPITRKLISRLPLDFPSEPVIVHGHYHHLVIIKGETLARLPESPDWGTRSALLLDEDWSLESARLGYANVWIPSLKYLHIRPRGSTRSLNELSRMQDTVGAKFVQKWGFTSGAKEKKELSFIEREYGYSKMIFSLHRRSFDYVPIPSLNSNQTLSQ